MPALLSLILASSASTKDDPSKIAFYVCGGLLIAWAITVSGLGMGNGDFPSSALAKRGVMAIGAVLVAAAMATAVITA